MTNRTKTAIINKEDNVAIMRKFIDKNGYIPSLRKTSSLLGKTDKYSAEVLNAVHFCIVEEDSIFTPNFVVLCRSVLRDGTLKNDFNKACSGCDICTNRYLSRQFKLNEEK